MKTTIKKVSQLINDGIMCPPIDGNHGEKHPKTADYVDDGIPFILVPDLKDGVVDLDNCNHISYDQAKTLNKGFSKTGDVLFTHKATIGKVAIVDTKEYEYIILTPQVTYYRVKNQDVLSNVYLYYYFCSNTFQNTFRLYASSGGTRDYLGIVAQQQLPIIFPNIDYQLRIVSILEKYDNLIRNNNKRIKLLEQVAENLYKEWFVRFRFPGHENAEFENGIPKGWQISRLKKFGRIETGKTPSTEVFDYYGDEYMFIKTPDMRDKIFVIQSEEYLSLKGHKTQPKKKLARNSIMVSCIGTGGIVAINAEEAHTNQQINSIIVDDPDFLEWLFYTCKGLKSTIEMYGATGTTMTNLSKGKFEKLKVIEPPNSLLIKFHEIVEKTLQKIKLLTYQNRNLIKQRDLLLPRLMSGKLEV